MKRINLIGLLLVAFTLSCSKVELTGEEHGCDKVDCTYDLRWISVKLVDPSGKPVALDRTKVTRISDGKDLTKTYTNDQWSIFKSLGSYPVTSDIDDEHIPKFKHTKVRFQGYIGNREVVKADYVVTFDCCHISLVSGELELVTGR